MCSFCNFHLVLDSVNEEYHHIPQCSDFFYSFSFPSNARNILSKLRRNRKSVKYLNLICWRHIGIILWGWGVFWLLTDRWMDGLLWFRDWKSLIIPDSQKFVSEGRSGKHQLHICNNWICFCQCLLLVTLRLDIPGVFILESF